MGRGGLKESKGNYKRRARSIGSVSDESDEDYVVEDEENVSNDDDSDEDFDKSLDVSESDASVDKEEEVELEDEVEVELRKVRKSKKRKGSSKNGKTGVKASRKRSKISYDEEEDEDYDNAENDEDDEEFTPEEEEELEEEEEEEFEEEEEREEEELEEEYDDDDDYINNLDEEKVLTVTKNGTYAKEGKRRTRGRSSRKAQKKRRKSGNSKKPSLKKRRVRRTLRKKESCEYDDKVNCDYIIEDGSPPRAKKKKNTKVIRRRVVLDPDSDFLSGSSDCDFTISEEEREQVREAKELNRQSKTSVRNTATLEKPEVWEINHQKISVGRKGKEKVKEEDTNVIKQVCGVCFSEEGKRRLRGALDCCSHYFCFTCIMEWSKVESRCPLCKQRFNTITKFGRSTVGVDLQHVVIQIPKRDQVYQPSEEEIRSYIDPYENVICTECHEGGDDGLMLLCDLCDSPAHTYCVGLGHEVPAGNWYCEGCRPVAIGSAGSQDQDSLPDQRAAGNMLHRPPPILNIGEDLTTSRQPSPRLAFTHGFANVPSPRVLTGYSQPASPVFGTGAPTLSERRQIQRRIQDIISLNRMGLMANGIVGTSAGSFRTDIPNSQINCEVTVQNPRTQERGMTQQALLDERLQRSDLPSSSLHDTELLFMRTTQLRRPVTQDPTVVITNGAASLTLWPELSRANPISGIEIMHQNDARSIIGCDDNFLTHRGREESHFYAVKEQLQSLVKSHLKSLSQDIELGNDTIKEITRRSTHTILAACRLEHKRSEVHVVPQPSTCTHFDKLLAGQSSLMEGFCLSCFESFVRDVVKRIMDTRLPLPGWLSLGL